MANYVFVRISDKSKQSAATQMKVVTEYAEKHKIGNLIFINKEISGSKSTREERGITDLIDNLKKGDKVIVSDIARLGRDSVSETVETITSIINRGAELHMAYSDSTLDERHKNDMAAMFIAIGEAYAAVKFSEERSKKAKAAHARRKAEGLKSGREVGSKNKNNDLDKHAVKIMNWLQAGTKKTDILRKLEAEGMKVHRSKLYRYIDNNLSGLGINKAA